jgi:hypothetical protein
LLIISNRSGVIGVAMAARTFVSPSRRRRQTKGAGTLVPSSLPVKGYGRVQVALAYLRRVEQETST